MNMTLIIVLAILIVATWLYAMYISWKATKGVPLALVESAPLLARVHRGLRLTRRGWYGAELLSKQALAWSNEKAGATFVKFFPKSAPVFVKHDLLTGLTHGPSSFFLKTISQPKKEARLPRTKKML